MSRRRQSWQPYVSSFGAMAVELQPDDPSDLGEPVEIVDWPRLLGQFVLMIGGIVLVARVWWDSMAFIVAFLAGCR